MNKPKTTRRTPEEMIAAREAEIEAIQKREAAKKEKEVTRLTEQVGLIQLRIEVLQEKQANLRSQIEELTGD